MINKYKITVKASTEASEPYYVNQYEIIIDDRTGANAGFSHVLATFISRNIFNIAVLERELPLYCKDPAMVLFFKKNMHTDNSVIAHGQNIAIITGKVIILAKVTKDYFESCPKLERI